MKTAEGAPSASETCLQEALDLCGRQHERLRSWKALSWGAAAGAACGAAALAAAACIFAAATFLAALAVRVATMRWETAPDPRKLRTRSRAGAAKARMLEEGLAEISLNVLQRNARRLRNARTLVACQGLGLTACALTLSQAL